MIIDSVHHHIPRRHLATCGDALFKSFQQQVFPDALPLTTDIDCKFGKQDCRHFNRQGAGLGLR